jgi:prepilin-type N-terminal cleavage/methylation domain-containing protein
MRGRPTTRLKRFTKVETGFTIIELMIATAIFSVILLILIVGVLHITNSYYRGITDSNTQNVARSIASDIAQTIQFEGGIVQNAPANPTAGTTYTFCVGNEQFYYMPGYQFATNPDVTNPQSYQSYHSFEVKHGSLSCPVPASGSVLSPGFTSSTGPSGVQEMLKPGMRLSNLTIAPDVNNPNLYTVSVLVVYGGSDLLCNPAKVSDSCSASSTMGAASDFIGPGVTCKSGAGSEFCSTSQLSSVVERRVD